MPITAGLIGTLIAIAEELDQVAAQLLQRLAVCKHHVAGLEVAPFIQHQINDIGLGCSIRNGL